MISLLFVCLVFIIGLYSTGVDAAYIELWTKEKCRETFRNVKTIKEFQFFANRLVDDKIDTLLEVGAIDNSISSIDGDVKMDTATLNRCMHSVDGLGDLEVLKGITENLSKVHSVCHTEFADQLIAFNRRMRDNIAHNKILFFTSKQKHRLSQFFGLLAGQVVLTCKKSLAKKLELAETDNDELIESLNLVIESATHCDNERSSTSAVAHEKQISTGLNFIFSLAKKNTTKVFDRVENILLLESMKPEPEAKFSIGITVNSQEKLEAFTKTKRACNLIGVYAENSIYTIAKLAWRGFLARDATDIVDTSLNEDKRVQKWIKAIQYCQGVLLSEVTVDLEQEELVKLDKDIFNSEGQLIAIDVNRDTGHHIDVTENVAVVEMQQPRTAHVYERGDSIEELDSDLRCYTYAGGFKGWLLKKVGHLLLTKFIRINVIDESFKRSLLRDYQDTESEVQFGSSAVAITTGIKGAEVAAAGATWAHRHLSGGSPGLEVSMFFALATACTLFVTSLIYLGDYWCREHHADRL